MKISKSFKVYIHTLIAVFLIMSNVNADSDLDKNIILYDSPKSIDNINLKNSNLQNIDLSENKGKIMILNFWATWCAPCKKEMPSLSRLADQMPEITIFAINMEKPNPSRAKNFLSDLNINNLDIYFDPNFDLAKKFKMRGLPTSILINKNGKEFARIIGETDFDTPRFKRFLRDNA